MLGMVSWVHRNKTNFVDLATGKMIVLRLFLWTLQASEESWTWQCQLQDMLLLLAPPSYIIVTPDTPMAFTSWNGDVDITFPSTVKATFKMRSDRSDILTDFDLELRRDQSRDAGKREDGVYKISIEEWTIGDVNGGGPEMLFKTYNGDVIIRKKR